MKHFTIQVLACLALAAAPIGAVSETLPADVLQQMQDADVIILGEIHDNPDHHLVQTEAVEAVNPGAMVWEMLTEEGATRISRQAITDPQKLSEMLKWAELGWPPLSMYLPVFRAAPDAPVYGAMVPREAAQAAMERGAATAMGADAALFGLTVALPPDEQAAREADQYDAHCEAIPPEMLPNLVAIQRLRDAVLSRAILRAHDEAGGPIVVVTGNGHARKDRGIPTYLARLRPGLRVFVLGQSEDRVIEGDFDAVIDSPAPAREDPCTAFGQQG